MEQVTVENTDMLLALLEQEPDTFTPTGSWAYGCGCSVGDRDFVADPTLFNVVFKNTLLRSVNNGGLPMPEVTENNDGYPEDGRNIKVYSLKGGPVVNIIIPPSNADYYAWLYATAMLVSISRNGPDADIMRLRTKDTRVAMFRGARAAFTEVLAVVEATKPGDGHVASLNAKTRIQTLLRQPPWVPSDSTGKTSEVP